jgi:proteic killer suppression protein
LRIPPGNRLESLSGNLKGYWSIRINQQWLVVFHWENGRATEVKITDYH